MKYGSVISSKSPSEGQRTLVQKLQKHPAEENQEMPIAVAK